MNNIINKSIIIFITSIAIIPISSQEKFIIAILLCIISSAFSEIADKEKLSLIFLIIYSCIACIYPEFLIGLPLLFYDIANSKYKFYGLFQVIPFIINYQCNTVANNIIIALVILISGILKYKYDEYERLQRQYIKRRDDLTEESLNLEKRVEELINRENYQIKMATLDERNRIAREIHDNVGHLLTSSIIQIGAVMAITKEKDTKDMLNNIKNTLDEGMNSIRSSIHDLHDDAVDLYLELLKIVKEFKFCEVDYKYNIQSDMDVKMKYVIISIVKEALANVIKHSNATKVTVHLYEHPKIYQLIIADNGTIKNKKSETGMGLEGMKMRVTSMGGNININTENGFEIFISFIR